MLLMLLQITAAAAVLYNASLSLAAAAKDNDELLMEIGSAAAQALSNGSFIIDYLCFTFLLPLNIFMYCFDVHSVLFRPSNRSPGFRHVRCISSLLLFFCLTL
jgi:hypothetical protein